MVYISDVCSTKNKNGQKYGFGGELCFLGHFFELMSEAFPFFCCLKPVFGSFWPEEGRFLTFFPEQNAAGMSEEVKKNAQKNTTNPQNHIYVHFYLFSNKRQRYIPTKALPS